MIIDEVLPKLVCGLSLVDVASTDALFSAMVLRFPDPTDFRGIIMVSLMDLARDMGKQVNEESGDGDGEFGVVQQGELGLGMLFEVGVEPSIAAFSLGVLGALKYRKDELLLAGAGTSLSTCA